MAEEEVAAAADGPCFTHSTYELTDEGKFARRADAPAPTNAEEHFAEEGSLVENIATFVQDKMRCARATLLAERATATARPRRRFSSSSPPLPPRPA